MTTWFRLSGWLAAAIEFGAAGYLLMLIMARDTS